MRTKTMLTGMTRFFSRVQKSDPRRFLHVSVQAPQNNQVPAERPRAVSRTSDSDPAKHGEQHEGQHYSIPPQDLKTVFPHGLPPRYAMQIKVQEKYVWNKRESTEKGSPLGEVVEQGLTRVRNATDAVGVVLKELKTQSSLGLFHLLVAVDGVNALWGRTTLKREDRTLIAPEELALVHNLRKMVKNDWHGGAIVLSLSQTGSLFKSRTAYLPHELLGKEGFNALEPFLPILISNYNPKEFESSFQYYLENNWLQHEKASTEEGRKELKFLSNCNPEQLERLCASL